MRPSRSGGRGGAAAVAAVALAAAASALLYLLLHRAQQVLFTNGLPTSEPFRYPRPGTDQQAIAAALASYWPLAGAIVALYLAVLVVVRLSGSRAAGRLALAAGVAGQLALLPTRPTLSIDLYSYLAHGYLAHRPGDSPYLTAAAAVAPTPFGQLLADQGWMPVHPQTPYGPAWTGLEALAMSGTPAAVTPALYVLKAVVVLAVLGTAVFAYLIGNRLLPGLGPLAAAGWLLNPVVLVEFAADGHNDALAIFFVAVAIWAALRGWGLLAVPALAMGALVKYTPAVFALALLVLLVRRRRSWRRLVVDVLGGAVIAAALAVVLWLPWWKGVSTLDGLDASTTPYPAMSPAGLLVSWWQDPYTREPNPLPRLVLSAVLVAVVLAASWGRTPRGTLIGCAVIAVAVLAVSPVYWPWYSALALAVLVLRPTVASLAAVAALTVGSVAAAPWGDLAAVGTVEYHTTADVGSLVGLTLPVAACALIALTAIVILVARRSGAREAGTPATEHPG